MHTILQRLARHLRPISHVHWQAGGQPNVLFVAGMDGAPMRYRVLNQAEQLHQAGLASAIITAQHPRLAAHVPQCDLLYLYRVDQTPLITSAIQTARKHHTPVVYDTDDLVWHERIVQDCALDEYYAPAQVNEFRALFERVRSLLQQVDVHIASTAYLAQQLYTDFQKPVFVNENAISSQAIALAQQAITAHQRTPMAEQLIIGYFSGWPNTHEHDLQIALPGVIQALEHLPQAVLRIIGHFDQETLPASVRQRLEIVPFVPYDQLYQQIAQVHINLAPLVDNPHRRCKSAVKFLEASLVEVPTVASNLEPYALIQQSQSGYRVQTSAEWYNAIMQLATVAGHAQAVGRAARQYVLAEHTTRVRASAFAGMLKHLVASA